MFVVLFISSLPVYALKLKIDPELIDPGKEPYQFEVKIEDAADLSAFQFDLTYDRTVITIDSVILGDFLGSTGRTVWDPLLETIDNDHGKLTFGAFSIGDAEGPSGDGILALITYTPSGPGTVGAVTFDGDRTYVTATQVSGALPRELEDAKVTPICEITVTPGAYGSISPSDDDGVVAVEKAGNETFTITPEECYQIAEVRVNGNPLDEPVSSYTFNNVTCDGDETYSIAADFKIKQFEITSGVSGDGGTISPADDPDPVLVNCGASQTFTITPQSTSPDQCYHITDVRVDGHSVGAVSSYTFENVTANHSITASFAINNFQITASAGPDGKIEPSGTMTLICEANQKFTITPDYGYHIVEVKVDGAFVGTESSYTFSNTGSGSHTIHAEFEKDYFSIQASVASDTGIIGNITPDGIVKVARDSTPTFTTKGADCYELTDITLNGSSVMADVQTDENGQGSYTLPPVNANHIIEATFDIRTYTINATADTGGSIDLSGDVTVECGGSQEFTIIPDDCYQITDVKIDGESVDVADSYTFTDVRDGHTIHAAFEKIPYTITADFQKGEDEIGKNGTVNPSEATVKCGENQIVRIIPNEGSSILEVGINGKKINCEQDDACKIVEEEIEYTFINVREDGNEIYAIFEGDNIYTIMASVAGDGKIEPSGEVTVMEEDDQTFSTTPSQDESLLYLVVDGVKVDAETEYLFPNIRDDHTIIAVFEEVTITVNAEGNGQIEPSGEVNVPLGLNQIFVITPDPCYQIADVMTGEGDSAVSVKEDVETDASGVGVYEFEEVTAPQTLSVTFEPVTITVNAGDGGNVSPSASVQMECGTTGQIFTITPDDCYQIADIRIGEGESASSVMEDVVINESGVGDFELKDVTQNDTLSVTYERITKAGDINDDGTVDLTDAVLALKVICGIDIIRLDEADTDGDYKLEMDDVLHFLQTGTKLDNAISILMLISGEDIITEKITRCADVDKDGKIGIGEVVHILKVLATPEEDEGTRDSQS